MNSIDRFQTLFGECPLIAIIRGVTPDEAEVIGEALFDGGIKIIEVPLNSPRPLESIARLQARLGERAVVGAGTVLDPGQVDAVRNAGGTLIVSPSTDAAVIKAAARAGMVACPGFFTPSEAFAAIKAGAHALKLFPAEAASPSVLRAMRAVLPAGFPVIVVGGVTPETMAPWREAGAAGFGLGSALYRPGQPPAETRQKAESFVRALNSQ